MAEETYLNDIWTVHFHDPYDTDWTMTSYIRIGTMSSVEEFWQHHDCQRGNLHKAMFFVMREHVFPMWDDPSNVEGGCLSIKVLKENMAEFWEDLCKKLLGESLLNEDVSDKWDLVNGISTSPKKHFCIIKVWLKDDTLSSKDFRFKDGYYGEIIYKSNRDNITNDNIKKIE